MFRFGRIGKIQQKSLNRQILPYRIVIWFGSIQFIRLSVLSKVLIIKRFVFSKLQRKSIKFITFLWIFVEWKLILSEFKNHCVEKIYLIFEQIQREDLVHLFSLIEEGCDGDWNLTPSIIHHKWNQLKVEGFHLPSWNWWGALICTYEYENQYHYLNYLKNDLLWKYMLVILSIWSFFPGVISNI